VNEAEEENGIHEDKLVGREDDRQFNKPIIPGEKPVTKVLLKRKNIKIIKNTTKPIDSRYEVYKDLVERVRRKEG